MQGHYCPAGSESATQVVCDPSATVGGPANFFCPRGSSAPVQVDLGYSTGGSTDPTGRTLQTICAPGTFCAGGLIHPCPSGTYGSTSGLSRPTCSGSCAAGSFSAAGAAACTECSAGSYSSSTGAGTCLECAAGKYSLSGASNCTDCPGGRFGTGSSPTADCSGPCEAGRWCAAGSSDPRQYGGYDRGPACGGNLRISLPLRLYLSISTRLTTSPTRPNRAQTSPPRHTLHRRVARARRPRARATTPSALLSTGGRWRAPAARTRGRRR